MFTLCFALFALGSDAPQKLECRFAEAKEVSSAMVDCSVIDQYDPMFTCQTKKVERPAGANLTFVIRLTDITFGARF